MDILNKSTTFRKYWQQLADRGTEVTIQMNKIRGDGSFEICSSYNKQQGICTHATVTLDRANPYIEQAGKLAHELGHIVFEKSNLTDPKLIENIHSKKDYVALRLRSEGSAAWARERVRHEILEATGGETDIGLGDKRSEQRIAGVYQKYKEGIFTEKMAVQECAKIYRNMTPSGLNNVSSTYSEYYGRSWEQINNRTFTGSAPRRRGG